MLSKQARIENLASQILLHKKLYYSGKAVIPDSAYDAMEDELAKLAPWHPVLSMVGYTLSESTKKIAHNPPMLSLSKTYLLEDLTEFIETHECVMSDKFDGMAIAVEYNGKGELVRASTRGNGKLGEDVTEHVFHVADIPKWLDIAKLHLNKFEVRGEVYFPISKFKDFEEQFDSYRNAVPGTFGRKEIDEAAPVLRVLRLCAYDVTLFDAESPIDVDKTNKHLHIGAGYLERLRYLEGLGFHAGVGAGTTHVVHKKKFSDDEIKHLFTKHRDYQIDGLVFRINDDATWERLGITSHHPRGSLAFKQTGDVAITRILEIEENVGRSGKITFRAKLEPVNLSGAKITYATLHNAEFIQSGGYAPGAFVKLTRSGEVIPSIIGLEEPPPKSYDLPERCPCGYPLSRVGPDLYCLEKRSCARKDQESLVHFVGTLDIFGISEKTVMRLREAGLVQEPADLFKLTAEDLMELEGFAKKSAENAIHAIHDKREIPLALFLASLGLKRGGIVKCQEVARKFVTLKRVMDAKVEDLMEEKGWAEKSAEDFVTSLDDKKPSIENLLKYVHVLDDTSAKTVKTGHPLSGMSVCITGALSRPRDEYKKMLEQVGAKVTDSVSSKTDFLVCNEASGSKKYTQALTLGVPILTEEQLLERL